MKSPVEVKDVVTPELSGRRKCLCFETSARGRRSNPERVTHSGNVRYDPQGTWIRRERWSLAAPVVMLLKPRTQKGVISAPKR